ncbi:(d)CMP kinase [Pelistega sp. NLN82]|uniref:Cytidylate kinase n=1 Tax=Pelistega ratti TaxID=2652177 RepID=A0A6L9Y685_9BURK|nr:(d)CMP kinase [Pelistega ratti]NEN75776.1 (d)CMP kinase [Pelistega ratti]
MNLITIDGPSASGKGTVSHLVAQHLGWDVLDSGALYRICAYAVLEYGLNADDEQAVAAVIPDLVIRFDVDRVYVNDQEVSEQLRLEHIGKLASKVAAYPAVRQALLDLQRSFLTNKGLVGDGRDMGTVIFPQAPLKIFLIADVNERAKRRYKQLVEKGIDADFEAILLDLQKRDEQDMNRAVAPLKPADDAIVIDSSYMGIQAVVDRILGHWEQVRVK